MFNFPRKETLFLLIKSLTKSEKRFFYLYSSIQKGDKIYLSLFHIYEKQKSPEMVKTLFLKEHPQSSFEMAAKHLYKVLMECLLKLRESRDVQATLCNMVLKADILFERELWENAFHELNKAKQLAINFENHIILLLIQRTELKFFSMMEFRQVNEKKLVAKQMKLLETMKHLRITNQHIQLYDIMKYRIIHHENIRSEKQEMMMNDLVLSELHLVANNTYVGFEPQKIHLLFQATYYLHSGNYKSAIRYYKELIALFEKNTPLMLNPPIYYFTSVIGVLDSLSIAGLFNEIPYFISKLQELEDKNHPLEFTLNVQAQRFIYESCCLLQTGNIAKTLGLIELYEDDLLRKISSLGYDIQLRLLLQLTIIYFSNGDLFQARKIMKRILDQGKLFCSLPVYKVARLINLLLQAELKNYDFFLSEINSMKRSMRYEKQNYQIEKLIFKFVQSYPLPLYKSSRLLLWKQFEKRIIAIKESKYESQLLKIFNFPAWIESKVLKKDFGEVLVVNSTTI